MTSVASHQSQYIPWPPYFRKIQAVDIFVLMDSVQFQKGGLQNRNRIRGRGGEFWLTIPVSGDFPSAIMEMSLPDNRWRQKHFAALRQSYGCSKYWHDYGADLEDIYLSDYSRLEEINERVLFYFLDILGITTKVVKLSDLEVSGSKGELLVSLTKAVGGTVYMSGLGAEEYIQKDVFASEGLDLVFMPSVPPVYKQFHGDFIEGLSIIDMIFNVPMDEIKRYMRGSHDPSPHF